METASLKAFATKARTDLIKEVGGRVTVVLAENSLARVESAAAVRALEEAIARDGRERIIDRVAYTWFNRIIALRFMDANGYTPSGVVSPEAGRTTGQPEVLAEAKAGTFDDAVVPGKSQDRITALLNGTRPSQDPQGEAYGLLLEAYCRSWHKSMPFMFEREGDYTELLIPTALLAADSVRDRAVNTLTEEVCRDVEVIGWLYQFYISDRKDEVFDGFKKNKKAGPAEIPAATQLFTPHWIVRYLVENSLGRLWLLNNASSRLAEQMDYYIKPVDEETDFLRITKPEELKIIDPAVGSGHMLTYAFDLLYAIYTEKGYDPAEIPGLILQHNLYGTEIDPRAGALAAFALTMKAAAKRKLFLKSPVQPNIRVLENIRFDREELDYLWSLTKGSGLARRDADEFWNAFEHADTFGSLIQPNKAQVVGSRGALEAVDADGDVIRAVTLKKAALLLDCAEYLSQSYAVAIANPPYMGSSNMNSRLRNWAEAFAPTAKADLFALFILRCIQLTRRSGLVAMVTMQSWMFLKAYERLRENVLSKAPIRTLAHFGARAFDSIPGERVKTVAFVLEVGGDVNRRGAFLRLLEGENEAAKEEALRDTVSSPLRRNHVSSAALRQVPESPIAYWVTDEIVQLFSSPPFATRYTARIGIQSGDNARHYRRWSEVSRGRVRRDFKSWTDFAAEDGDFWVPLEAGGDRRKWYGNATQVVRLGRNGSAIRGTPNGSLRNNSEYFKSAVVWNRLNEGRMGFRLVPAGHAFDDLSPFAQPNGAVDPHEALAILGSDLGRELLGIVGSGSKTEVGHVNRLPLPKERSSLALAAEIAGQLVELAHADWDLSEQSLDFSQPAVAADSGAPLSALVDAARLSAGNRASSVRDLQLRLDRAVAEAYGVKLQAETTDVTLTYDRATSDADLILDLVSYAVGCMFGRYSLDKPGLILADQGSTLQDYLRQVPAPSFMPDRDNVIPVVDGDWFEDDIVARFRQFLRAAFGEEHFEENLRFVTHSLGVKDIRDYFVKSFYADHVKRYKKRPIYWLFRSPKGSFNALIYLHRYTPSTASTVLTGYLREFIGKLEANLEHQGRVAAGMGDASPREVAAAQKEADRIRKVLVELRDYEHDVLFPLAGKQIALDLDDGVLVNYQKLGSALKDIGLTRGGGGE